jgi:hypothetical protein
MMISLRRLLTMVVLAYAVLLGFTTPVYASPQLQGRPANLAIDPLLPLITGTQPTLTLHLTAEFGQPISNQPIIIFVDGTRKAEGKTDSRGIVVIPLKYKFAAGTYHVKAVYPGITSIGVNRATAETDLIIQPAKTSLYTVPPIPGVQFKLGNQIYTTDAKGTVDVEIGRSGIYTLEVLPIDAKNSGPNTRMQFARWNDNVFTAKRQVYFPRTRPLEAGFTVSYLVRQEFFDSKGNSVDPARVSSLTLRSAGTTYSFDKAGPVWLPANRLTRRISEHLESEQSIFYIRDISIDGTSVINKSEQRFSIRPNDVWPIQVLLYSVNFSARDAMFHFPIGKGIELTYPDGRTKVFLFDSTEKEVTIPALARGSYSAKIIGAIGSAPPTPVHLSRDLDAELLMLSMPDIAVIFGIPLAIALAFFFIGRPRWFQVLRHPSRYRELVYQNSRGSAR